MDLAEQVVVMENGCMCCTLRGDLLGAFDAIRRQMESGSPLDAVLVETTGMADPLPIVRTIRNTPDIARHFHMDGTITLVDCKTVLNRLGECTSDDQERHRQISFADKILLSKTDLVDNTQVAEVWQRLRSFNDAAPIVAAVKGVIPSVELTNLGAFDMDRIAAEQEQGHGHEHNDGHGHGHDCEDHDCEEHGEMAHGHGHGHAHSQNSRHESDIGSFSIVKRGVEIDKLAFARWIRVIATLPAEQGILYRSKGIIAAAGLSKKLIFHAVADVTETQDGPEWGEHEQRMSRWYSSERSWIARPSRSASLHSFSRLGIACVRCLIFQVPRLDARPI
jgi:G3E family GTPase